LRARIRHSVLSDAPRQAGECAASQAGDISGVLALAAGAGRFEPSAELEREAFHLIEAARSAGLLAATLTRAAHRGDGALESRAELRRAAAKVARLVEAGADREALSSARRELEAVQRRRFERDAEVPGRKAYLVEPDVARLSSGLAADEAFLSFWAYGRIELLPASTASTSEVPSLCAFVVRAHGRFARVELGPLAPIQTRVEAWLSALSAADAAPGAPSAA